MMIKRYMNVIQDGQLRILSLPQAVFEKLEQQVEALRIQLHEDHLVLQQFMANQQRRAREFKLSKMTYGAKR